VKFGVGVPTATEGLMYPVPYASIEDAVELAVMAEELGFESVWGNDHIASQRYVQAQFDDPPHYYDPLGYLAFVSAKTARIRLATCVIVLPFRHPVVAAKQLATLDHLSGGRLVVGVGIGAYREEFEALQPGVALHRGRYAEEAIRSLQLLFTQRRASFDGEYVRFADVESYPKPRQPVLPILSGGNSVGSKDRAARLGQGWLPACLTPEELTAGISEIRKTAADSGRELPAGFEVALQDCEEVIAGGRAHAGGRPFRRRSRQQRPASPTLSLAAGKFLRQRPASLPLQSSATPRSGFSTPIRCAARQAPAPPSAVAPINWTFAFRSPCATAVRAAFAASP